MYFQDFLCFRLKKLIFQEIKLVVVVAKLKGSVITRHLTFDIERIDANYFWNGSHAVPMQRPFFSPKLSYLRNVSLAVYLPIFYISFCQKTNLHLYKWSRLSSLLFTFSKDLVPN